jgi:hypothetical protein
MNHDFDASADEAVAVAASAASGLPLRLPGWGAGAPLGGGRERLGRRRQPGRDPARRSPPAARASTTPRVRALIIAEGRLLG